MKTNKKSTATGKAASTYVLTKETSDVANEGNSLMSTRDKPIKNTKNDFKNDTKNELKSKGRNASIRKKEDGNVTIRKTGKENTINSKNKEKDLPPLTPKSVRKEKKSISQKRGTYSSYNNVLNASNINQKETNRLQNSPRKVTDDNKKDKEKEKEKEKDIDTNTNAYKKKITKGIKLTSQKKDSPGVNKLPKGKLKIKNISNNETKKTGENNKKTKQSKGGSSENIALSFITQQHSQSSNVHGDKNDIKNMTEYNTNKEKEKQETTEKVLKKYEDHFEKCKQLILGVKTNDKKESLKLELNRSQLNDLMKLSWKCLDFDFSIACTILLLLDLLKKTETELTDTEKDNLENTIRSYGNKSVGSYKYIFKIHFKKRNKEDTDEDIKIKKNTFDLLRGKMKNLFLSNFEIIINLISCILYRVEKEDKKIFFIHLRGHLYKLISDITDTGIKYKYEKLAHESYEQAIALANRHMSPSDFNYLNLIYNYVYFLHFILGEEEWALDICKDAFDKASNALEKIENEEEMEKCLQILNRMRCHIKHWTHKLNKDMLLFLKF